MSSSKKRPRSPGAQENPEEQINPKVPRLQPNTPRLGRTLPPELQALAWNPRDEQELEELRARLIPPAKPAPRPGDVVDHTTGAVYRFNVSKSLIRPSALPSLHLSHQTTGDIERGYFAANLYRQSAGRNHESLANPEYTTQLTYTIERRGHVQEPPTYNYGDQRQDRNPTRTAEPPTPARLTHTRGHWHPDYQVPESNPGAQIALHNTETEPELPNQASQLHPGRGNIQDESGKGEERVQEMRRLAQRPERVYELLRDARGTI